MKYNDIISVFNEYGSCMLERHHLNIIREVERQGSLTAAADKLCLTQSALSHAMRKLELHIGCAVWLREGRRLQLTQAGAYLLDLANRVLPQMERAEAQLQHYASGHKGTLRIGMECHPCYEWLLRVVSPYLDAWPDVDVDVKQQFQFGGIGALFTYEIDLLVTPDPLFRPGLHFESVFDYEQVLVVSAEHALAQRVWVSPQDLLAEVLITYPVEASRLDVFTQFLQPANIMPKQHKTIETTDIMLQMVAGNRGVAALPRWLVATYQNKLDIVALRLGEAGVHKHIYLGARERDLDTEYLQGFFTLSRAPL